MIPEGRGQSEAESVRREQAHVAASQVFHGERVLNKHHVKCLI